MTMMQGMNSMLSKGGVVRRWLKGSVRAWLVLVVAMGLGASGFSRSSVKSPLIWKVGSEGGDSFVMGTVHLGVSLADMPPIVTDKLRESEMFVMEADFSNVNRDKLQDWRHLPAGVRLSDFLSPRAWRRLVDLLPDHDEEKLQRLKPWWVCALITRAAVQGLGLEGKLDAALKQKALELGLDVVALEDWRTGTAATRASCPVWRLESRLRMPGLMKDIQSRIAQIIEQYKNGELEGRSNAKRVQDGYDERELDKVIVTTQRTRAWMAQIEDMIERGGAFIAVGAGHVSGDEALISRLRDKGYPVTRLSD